MQMEPLALLKSVPQAVQTAIARGEQVLADVNESSGDVTFRLASSDVQWTAKLQLLPAPAVVQSQFTTGPAAVKYFAHEFDAMTRPEEVEDEGARNDEETAALRQELKKRVAFALAKGPMHFDAIVNALGIPRASSNDPQLTALRSVLREVCSSRENSFDLNQDGFALIDISKFSSDAEKRIVANRAVLRLRTAPVAQRKFFAFADRDVLLEAHGGIMSGMTTANNQSEQGDGDEAEREADERKDEGSAEEARLRLVQEQREAASRQVTSMRQLHISWEEVDLRGLPTSADVANALRVLEPLEASRKSQKTQIQAMRVVSEQVYASLERDYRTLHRTFDALHTKLQAHEQACNSAVTWLQQHNGSESAKAANDAVTQEIVQWLQSQQQDEVAIVAVHHRLHVELSQLRLELIDYAQLRDLGMDFSSS